MARLPVAHRRTWNAFHEYIDQPTLTDVIDAMVSLNRTIAGEYVYTQSLDFQEQEPGRVHDERLRVRDCWGLQGRSD